MNFSSRRFVTDQQFFKDVLLPNERRKMDEDFLLECSNCHVVVHRRCYPIFEGIPGFNVLNFLKRINGKYLQICLV